MSIQGKYGRENYEKQKKNLNGNEERKNFDKKLTLANSCLCFLVYICVCDCRLSAVMIEFCVCLVIFSCFPSCYGLASTT